MSLSEKEIEDLFDVALLHPQLDCKIEARCVLKASGYEDELNRRSFQHVLAIKEKLIQELGEDMVNKFEAHIDQLVRKVEEGEIV